MMDFLPWSTSPSTILAVYEELRCVFEWREDWYGVLLMEGVAKVN